MQPRWVQMPTTTSHWSCPGLMRSLSACGSGRLASGTLWASSISFLVRWLTKIGLPRQNTLMTWPSAMGVRSTSMGTPAAIVEASGFIWAISGTSVAPAPIAPTAAVATKRKSRRVGSAADMVVTVSVLSVLHTVHPLSGAISGPPGATRRRRMGPIRGEYAALHHRAGLLAPLPAECKPANAAIAGDLPGKRRALTRPGVLRPWHGGTPDLNHANRLVRARDPSEHRHHATPGRLAGAGGPPHRAGRLSGQRQRFPARRDGLPQPGRGDPPRVMA